MLFFLIYFRVEMNSGYNGYISMWRGGCQTNGGGAVEGSSMCVGCSHAGVCVCLQFGAGCLFLVALFSCGNVWTIGAAAPTLERGGGAAGRCSGWRHGRSLPAVTLPPSGGGGTDSNPCVSFAVRPRERGQQEDGRDTEPWTLFIFLFAMQM